MKNIKLLSVLILVMILLFAACKKEEEENDPIPPVIGKVLKKYTFDGIQYKCKYNSYNQLESFDVEEVGSSDISFVEFEYSGNKLMQWVSFADDKKVAKAMFSDFNAYDKPALAELYIADDTSFKLVINNEYTYTDDKLIELKSNSVDAAGQVMGRSKIEIIYNVENVVIVKSYTNYIGTFELDNIIEYTFDEKNNPGLIFRPINFVAYELFPGMSSMDLNNYITKEFKDVDGNTKESVSYNRDFEYNANDYPSKCIMTSFDGFDVIDIKYDY